MVKGEGKPRISTQHTDKYVYDPDQNEDEKREVNRALRGNLKETHDAKDAPDVLERWEVVVKKANETFVEIKSTDAAVKDADVLTALTSGVAAKAQAMRSGTGSFDIDDFVSHLLRFMRDGAAAHVIDEDDEDEAEDAADIPLRWDKIGRKALAKSHRVPVMDFMLGPLEIEQKKRAFTKRTKFEKNKEDEKKPQEITEADITRSENETTKNVVALEKLLEQQAGPVNLLKFIINPHDFGQSVENLFYLSFLIRDAKCALDYEAGGQPMIYLCEAPQPEDYQDGVMKRQIVMELDMATWRRAIEVFDIKDSIIPQRPKAETRIGNKWYG